MGTRDGRLTWLVGTALFVYYLLTLGGHHYSVDGIVMFESAKQLFFRGSPVLEPPIRWGTDVIAVNTYGVGLMLAYLPVLALASPLFYWEPSLRRTLHDPALAHDPALYGNLAYLVCSWLNPLVTAATGSLVFLMARRAGLTRGWAVSAALAFGVASPAAAYARYDFSQPLAALALTAAVAALTADARGEARWPLPAAGAALTALLVTRPDLGVVVPWIVLWSILRARRAGWRPVAARVAALAAAAAVGVGVYVLALHAGSAHWWPFTPTSLGRLFTFSGTRPITGAFGLLLSPGHGLLIFFPLAWLAVPGFLRLVRERDPLGALAAGTVTAALILYAGFNGWWGGWSWGPRFLVPIVPLVALAATVWASRAREAGPRLFAGLGALGVLVAWNGILLDFVLFYGRAKAARGGFDVTTVPFDLTASPLVSGWSMLGTIPVDLLLLRMGQFAGVPGWMAAVLVTATLISVLVWTVRRLRATLRDSPGPPEPRDQSC